MIVTEYYVIKTRFDIKSRVPSQRKSIFQFVQPFVGEVSVSSAVLQSLFFGTPQRQCPRRLSALITSYIRRMLLLSAIFRVHPLAKVLLMER